jgi:plastocyanin
MSEQPKKRTSSSRKAASSEPTTSTRKAAPAEHTTRKAAPAEHTRAAAHDGREHRHSNASSGLTGSKLAVIIGLMTVAFFGAYNFAVARGQSGVAGAGSVSTGAYSQQPSGVSAGGGGCCGGGGAPVEGSATTEGGVQKISVDTSAGSFNPNVIKVKAGVPVEIAFSKSGGGCLSGVYFPDFNINEDLTGGPKTVKLPALQKGTYTFYCQMQMVSAQIIAE